MLRAFVDASKANRPGDPPVLAIAGFVGTVPGWSSFQKKWREARTRSGIEYFHMTDFMSRKSKPYRDWTEIKRKAVIGRLIDLVNSHLMFAVATAVNVPDFYAQSNRDVVRSGNNPYVFCACSCVALVAHALQFNNINEPVLWVFESGDRGHPGFIAAMNRICLASEKTREDFRIFSVMPGTKKKFPGLDAADFLAWETPQHVQRMRGDSPGGMSSYINRLTVKIFNHYVYGEHIRQFVADDTPEERAAIESLFGVRVREKSK